jgi:hypothetical protein
MLINMPDRTDRLKVAMRELSRLADREMQVGEDVDLIVPRRFDDAGGFINAAYRSCLDSHLQAARHGLASGDDWVLVFEDDFTFDRRWLTIEHEALSYLRDNEWDLASLGYIRAELRPSSPGVAFEWQRFSGELAGSHAYLLHQRFLPTWIDHLEAIAVGQPGDDLQGPMAPDGATNTITWRKPEVVRLVAAPCMFSDRPSRSDLMPSRLDRTPVLRHGIGVLRQVVHGLRHR